MTEPSCSVPLATHALRRNDEMALRMAQDEYQPIIIELILKCKVSELLSLSLSLTSMSGCVGTCVQCSTMDRSADHSKILSVHTLRRGRGRACLGFNSSDWVSFSTGDDLRLESTKANNSHPQHSADLTTFLQSTISPTKHGLTHLLARSSKTPLKRKQAKWA
jgi:hypothetical protein